MPIPVDDQAKVIGYYKQKYCSPETKCSQCRDYLCDVWEEWKKERSVSSASGLISPKITKSRKSNSVETSLEKNENEQGEKLSSGVLIDGVIFLMVAIWVYLLTG